MPTQDHTTGLGGMQRGLGAFADQAPLFLGQGGVDVQHMKEAYRVAFEEWLFGERDVSP
jgi:hypothetical protein